MGLDNIKGRGTALNPDNRFENIKMEILDEYLEHTKDENEKPVTQFFNDNTKSILAKNDSDDLSFNFSINPYRGCEHGCIYCYARPTHEYLGFSSGLDFETKIMVKSKASSLLEKEFQKASWEPQMVLLSGNTDCYQPAERKLKITRSLIEVFLKYKNPLAIITKNSLIERDLDLLLELSKLNLVFVTISIPTLDKEIAAKMEPRTSAPSRRLKTVEALSKAGIYVNVNIAPVVPGLTDDTIPFVLKSAADAGAKSARKIILRLPWQTKELFTNWVEKNFPARSAKILNRVKSLRDGELYKSGWSIRMTGEGEWADTISQIFYLNCRRNNLNIEKPFLRNDLFEKNPEQERLF
ncbi:MAG: PA0069 family radical SAM protein [Bacteroidetes bacterium]|nr:PA0069 family radical SAM protein [Bacteroidota bacterium]MBX7046926.1 PA0069 family radical SAM protein [Ignavibacteria bacterium]